MRIIAIYYVRLLILKFGIIYQPGWRPWINQQKPGMDAGGQKHSSKKRAIHLKKKLAAHPEEDGDQKFYCDEKIVKSYVLDGKKHREQEVSQKVYLSVPTANMPEISEELFKTMDRDGLLSQTETTMNMEVYDEGSSEVNSNKWY